MPCRDYESDDYAAGNRSSTVIIMKTQADKLARIACTAMKAYEAGETFASLLENKEVAVWWTSHKKADEKERVTKEKAKEKAATLARIKKEAAAKLTDEELAAFGLHKNGNKK